MIHISRRKSFLGIAEIFFASDPSAVKANASILFFVQARTPLAGLQPFKTQVIDLSQSLESLKASLSRNTRYKINRAEREHFRPHIIESPSYQELNEFSEFYDTFAAQKNISPANRQKLRALAQQNGIIISYIFNQGGERICAHTYVRDNETKRVRLLYSCSHFRAVNDTEERNAIGRANRYLHWHEIESFQQRGILSYDLGGLPMNDSDPVKNAIAKFKLEFGGSQIIEYSGFVAQNIMGKLALRGRRSL